ncbi:MAG: hypothetical protein ACI4T9_00485 [Prevotella sp.]|jgi:hypothetical protein
MRKSAHLFAALFLSALIIVLSVGIVRVHCEHRGDLSFAQIERMAHGHDECAPMKKCMKVTVSKLSPSQVSSPFHLISFQPVIAVIPTLISVWMPTMFPREAMVHAVAPHAPPRAYLSLLRILRL